MYATERQDEIERILQLEGRLVVIDLAQRLDVTTETVRRDLGVLEQRGVLRRVHGGAVGADRSSTREISLTERIRERGDAKGLIAAAALDELGSGFAGSVFLDAGSTVGAIAERLPAYLEATQGTADAVTHAYALAPSLAASDRVTLTLIGGRIRGVTGAAVGASTTSIVAGLRPDVAFIGTNGLSADFGLSTPDPEEAAVKRAIVAAARRIVVVSDSRKFDTELLVGFAPLSAIDTLVTDAEPSAELAAALAEAGVEVRVA
ncbi:DeoR/GlpR family DNA-binding transcription regulator [Microbacterium sp. cx-55]|uniref:DeoR/GlpR family DNA-binding transcription regulator n=1 Tax=unclassified Microbacterium TaxID=2609290 RepID=UPI001CBE7AC1|nr:MULTISPECIES: DeoR/GlpR family DNA-binding transcription regulator [unclassified Microbacterium]MBZ4486085.1 DeoR/GlpR family DNA-binding transcription regulator [Microbacterium sp. cx-55]MCC4907077.1 DeoR/GlpR family DNA-binding transcription regulator [Microbacterium sp. cx-59]UGB34044.1 DeoR/GlpR family DNA-binding transcription regulator [Microbacterium sp. cx-55]